MSQIFSRVRGDLLIGRPHINETWNTVPKVNKDLLGEANKVYRGRTYFCKQFGNLLRSNQEDTVAKRNPDHDTILHGNIISNMHEQVINTFFTEILLVICTKKLYTELYHAQYIGEVELLNRPTDAYLICNLQDTKSGMSVSCDYISLLKRCI